MTVAIVPLAVDSALTQPLSASLLGHASAAVDSSAKTAAADVRGDMAVKDSSSRQQLCTPNWFLMNRSVRQSTVHREEFRNCI
eukprot:3413524-Prymnesium_polylepis.1